jgi:hypothetical protein
MRRSPKAKPAESGFNLTIDEVELVAFYRAYVHEERKILLECIRRNAPRRAVSMCKPRDAG